MGENWEEGGASYNSFPLKQCVVQCCNRDDNERPFGSLPDMYENNIDALTLTIEESIK